MEKYARERGLPFYAISAVSGAGVKELVRAMADELQKMRPALVREDFPQGPHRAEERQEEESAGEEEE